MPASNAPPTAASVSTADKPSSATASAAAASSTAAKPSAAASAAAKPAVSGLTHVKIGVTSKDANYLFLYLAQDLGIFAKHGLDAEIVVGQPAALTTGLAQGDVDFYATPSTVAQGAERGLPLRLIMVASDQPLYFLVGDMGISQIAQLKGKQIAGSPPGQIPSLVTDTLLQLGGLKTSDYTIVPTANDPARAALVESHNAAAAVVGFNEMTPLIAAGHPLIDTAVGKVFFPIVGLGVTTSTLQNRRDMAQRAVDAALEAVHLIVTDKDQTVGVLTKDFGLSQADASKAYDLAKPAYTTNGRASEKAVQFQLDSDAKNLNLPQPFKEDQIYDYSLLPKSS
ncbi:MAG TPA: ABC transporter substrate-binding protein [Chloroflexota bacterium]|nr:ABC transporter substrate-binding protein [Chloroflexota bacterium]